MRVNSVRRHALIGDMSDDRSLADRKGILLDWDGCVAVGNRILPDARRFIERAADRVAILSNNSTHLPEDIAVFLAREGLSVPADRIVLAGAEAIRWAAARRPARILLLASPRIMAYALSQQLTIVRDSPDMVMVMRDVRFTYGKLERAVSALAAGARLVAANADRTHPGPGRRPIPETGALLAALTACMPGIEACTIGKPGPLLFEKACAALRIAPHEAVMIGDNPETDGAGARALGMRSIIVGEGSRLGIGDLIV